MKEIFFFYDFAVQLNDLLVNLRLRSFTSSNSS